ncbi:MAG: flagellar FliJ family protein [Desulfotomaculum sp.]|nr:flagellar FliJ family protein [Desulfotomaculum sp.]
MKKFVFRLQQVLEQREKKEQEALREQSRAEKLYQERLAALEKTREAFNKCLTESLTYNPNNKLHYILYQDYLKQKISRQEVMLKQAEQKLAEARQKALEARKERMTLEKLKERHLEEYIEFIKGLENKQNDELATGMYNRRQNPAG